MEAGRVLRERGGDKGGCASQHTTGGEPSCASAGVTAAARRRRPRRELHGQQPGARPPAPPAAAAAASAAAGAASAAAATARLAHRLAAADGNLPLVACVVARRHHRHPRLNVARHLDEGCKWGQRAGGMGATVGVELAHADAGGGSGASCSAHPSPRWSSPWRTSRGRGCPARRQRLLPRPAPPAASSPCRTCCPRAAC